MGQSVIVMQQCKYTYIRKEIVFFGMFVACKQSMSTLTYVYFLFLAVYTHICILAIIFREAFSHRISCA